MISHARNYATGEPRKEVRALDEKGGRGQRIE